MQIANRLTYWWRFLYNVAVIDEASVWHDGLCGEAG